MIEKKIMASISVICLMIAMIFPTYTYAADLQVAEESSTTLTTTVPEQPEAEIIVSAETTLLKYVALPEGWAWKKPGTKLVSGTFVEVTAVYRNGDITVEKTIRVGRNVNIVKYMTDASYVIRRNTSLTITCTGDISALQSVAVDGKDISDANYTKKKTNSGFTALTFKKSYMDTLTVGTHTITLTYPVGSVSTTVRVSKASFSWFPILSWPWTF